MVFLNNEGTQRKSKKFSERWPSKPSKFDLCRSGHLPYDLAELIDAAADAIGEGKDGTIFIECSEVVTTGVTIGKKSMTRLWNEKSRA